MDVTITRPSVTQLLRDLVTPPSPKAAKYDADEESLESAEDAPVRASDRLRWAGVGGGVGVCAAGPESLTRGGQNAVARVSLTRGLELGGVGLHTELFAI